MAAKKTLLIVDDHTLFREGLKTIISRNPAYEVVGETGRGETAIQMAKSLRPDLILVDISLPDQSGIELTLQLRKSLPKTFIMMVTMHSKVDYIVKAFQAGATGFVRRCTKDRIEEALFARMSLEELNASNPLADVFFDFDMVPMPPLSTGWPSSRSTAPTRAPFSSSSTSTSAGL